MRRASWILVLSTVAMSPAAAAQAAPAAPPDPNAERIEVTATRIPEDADSIPGSLTIITGDDMRRRGVRDLRGALSLAAGVDIAPGGDGGPLSYVPELWGCANSTPSCW